MLQVLSTYCSAVSLTIFFIFVFSSGAMAAIICCRIELILAQSKPKGHYDEGEMMGGPITIFDKSFLQALSVDEAVWFDWYFYSNICPLFFVETLADLSKNVVSGRTPEREVEIIAEKTPEFQGRPNIFHGMLCEASLLGYPVEMEGRVIVPPGGQFGMRVVREWL